MNVYWQWWKGNPDGRVEHLADHREWDKDTLTTVKHYDMKEHEDEEEDFLMYLWVGCLYTEKTTLIYTDPDRFHEDWEKLYEASVAFSI